MATPTAGRTGYEQGLSGTSQNIFTSHTHGGVMKGVEIVCSTAAIEVQIPSIHGTSWVRIDPDDSKQFFKVERGIDYIYAREQTAANGGLVTWYPILG